MKDKCGNFLNPNPFTFNILCPRCEPIPSPKVAKWSQRPGFLTFPTNPNGHGGDRPSDFDWQTLMEQPGQFAPPNWVIAEDFRSDGRPILCVRWWGSYMPGFEPGTSPTGAPNNTFFEDGFVLSFFSDFQPATGGPGRPDKLLGTYVAPLSLVKITPTQFIGCDDRRIWQDQVRLQDTCLDHPVPDIATPRAFLERSNVVYWLAITAEVGHEVVPLYDPSGEIVDWDHKETGKRATTHFWGWHTSPRQVEDRSVMGHVVMQGADWIYPENLWQPNPFFCQEVDQAFELLTLPPPCETNAPGIILVTIDCEAGKITVMYSEAMDPFSAGSAANYSLTGATIDSVVLSADGKTATIFSDDLKCGTTYILDVRDVKDLCGNVLDPNPQRFVLPCPPCPEPKVSKWSQLPGFFSTTANPNFRGFDRPSDFDWITMMQSGTSFGNPNWVIAEDFRSDGRPILCVRWWGSYMPGFEPTPPTTIAGAPPNFFEDGYVLSFFSDIRPAGAPSRPDRLLGTYVAPLSSIKITPTQFLGCDSNRIWQYEVALENTCLEHADPTIARPEAFLERSNVVYWVAITAEVGHQIIAVRDAAGKIVDWRHQPSGKRASTHFWGWHTSPRQVEDRSVMGHVLMQGTNWIYPANLWMPNQVVCNEIDQAFELLTRPPPCETNPPVVITVSANCDSNIITVVFNEAMDPATAGAVGSYTVSGGVIVNSVTLNAVGDTASLFTTDLLCASNYTVAVRNVRDLCNNLINPNPYSATFVCPPCPPVKIAKWSQLPAYLSSPTIGNGRGVNRPSDIDWVTLMQNPTAFVEPNWVIAEDFRSDGRPILCVRWWGSYLRTVYEPTTSGVFFEDGYVISFFSNVQPAGGGPGRPGRLLGSYVAPIEAVKKMPSQFLGCDDHRIWQYQVALKDTCLDHAVASIARPAAFLEKSNVVYWIAITAEVGHRLIPIRDNHGRVVDWQHATSGKRAQEHYWGWHTSPTNRLTGSLMGHVLMQGTNWIYPNVWMPNPVVCNELDQAFELLTGPVLCPPPATLNIVRSGGAVVISWLGDFTLQGSPVLANPGIDTEWSDVTTASPAVVPTSGTNRFFRLICP